MSHLDAVSIEDLQSEIRRRERQLRTLERRREKLLEQLAMIDEEISAAGGAIAQTEGRKRPRNEQNLADALVELLRDQTLNVTRIAEEVQRAGYRTTSPNFRTIVNQTLIKDKRFERVGRGMYTAKANASSDAKKTGKKRSNKRSSRSS
jgi:septal ring factor EnvC (AmiA/AmiB activator)